MFFVILKRHSSGSNRTPPDAQVCFFLFFLCCPAAFYCSAHFGRASCFLAFSSGCHSGPRAFLGFSLNLRGLSSLAPSEALFLGTRGGRGVSWLLFLGLCFPLLFCSAASHVLLEGPANGSTYGRPGALDVPPLVRVRARGSPSAGGGLVPSCFGMWLPYFVGRGSQGPRAFLSGMGAFFVPPHRPFFTRTCFCFPPQVFFFLRERDGPRGPAWIASRNTIQCRMQNAAPRIPRNTLRNPGYVRPPPSLAFFGSF